jgi:DNA polymerase-1
MAEVGLFDTPTERPAANGHKIVIIDGHALAYRSYYAIRELHTSKGRPTNAIYGFIRSLLRILQEEGVSDATVITFDAPAKTFRHEQYENYKAGRAPTPDDLPQQIDTIKRLIDLLGLHRIEVAGLEADDLFGTIAKRCEALGYHVEIVTSDRDAYQLVSDRITVRGLDKAERFGPEDVYKKYGVTVAQWVDYRALTGDASDNIPGAKGIGPVSAKKLLQNYLSLDAIIENLDAVEPASYAEKIRASLDDVRFSRELSRIVTDADIDVSPETWANHEMDKDALAALLSELEFGSVLRELGLSAVSTPAVSYQAVDSVTPGGALGFVLSSASAMQAKLLDLAVANDGQVAKVDEGAMLERLSQEKTLNACDAKALCVYAKRHGLSCEPGDDPLLMAYLIDPNATAPGVVVQRYGAPDWGGDAASRAIATAELLRIVPERLSSQQRELYARIEKPLQAVLADMEHVGVALDTALLKAQSEKLAAQLSELEAGIRKIAENPDLNVNSRDQLAELLFDKLKLQAGKRTATGKRSTAVSALEPLASKHEVVRLILEYRELAKLKSTYLDPLPSLIHPETGRLHTTFNQTVVATGRLSSTNPNLQNIPVRTEIGRQIRRAFIAREGHVLLVADYSQIELRILAHIAEEPALIDAFQQGEDIHARTASQVYGVALEAVTPEMRRVAKIINFGVLYGMSAHRLTRELSIDYDEADRYIKSYFAGYPKVQQYIDATLQHARKHGYVETLLGRRRMIPDINASNRNAREYAERTAYNMPIQGTAADIMKLAMIQLAPKLPEHDAHITLQVHDELIIEAPKATANALAPVIQDTMQQAFALRVPLVAEVGIGQNWLEAK